MPKRKDTVRITAVFTKEQSEKLNAIAEKQARSVSSLIAQSVQEFIDRYENQKAT